jgi:hypothetical protein
MLMLAALIGFQPRRRLLPDFAGSVFESALGSFRFRQLQQCA